MSNDINDNSHVEAFRTMSSAGITLPGLSDISQTTYTLSGQKVWIPSTRDIWSGYSKMFGGQSTSDINEGSVNRFIATESRPTAQMGQFDYIETPDNWNETQPVPEHESWNARPAALKSIYENIGSRGSLLKHVGFNSYEELFQTFRPAQYQQTSSRYAAWPTRSFYEGQPLAINPYGNSKKDMHRAADEDLQSNTLNILTGKDSFSGFVGQLGICFCFVI